MITSLLKQAMISPGFKFITVETEEGFLDEIFGAVRDARADDGRFTTRFSEAWSRILGGLRYREHKLKRYNIFNTIATPGLIEYIDKLDGVKTVTLDREYRTPEGFIREKYEEYRRRYIGVGEERFRPLKPGWIPTSKITEALGIDQAHREGFTGKGVKVATLDTGCSYSVQLTGANITRERTTVERRDDSGHGHEVASQIVGQRMEKNGVVFQGGAPDCELLSVKVLQTPLGIGTACTIAAGVEMAEEWGAQFINMSLGSEVIDDQGADVVAINHATDNGIIVGVAAGNAGKETVGSPAYLPNVIAVGSEAFDGKVAEFSSWGTAPSGRKIPDCTSLGGSNSSDPPEYVYSSTSPLSLGDFLDRDLDAMTIMMGSSQGIPFVVVLMMLAQQAGYIATIEDVRKVLKKNPWTKEKGYGRLTWDMFGG